MARHQRFHRGRSRFRLVETLATSPAENRGYQFRSISFARRPTRLTLAVAPRFAGRAGARSIIYDAAIARPDESPTVAKIIFRITRVRLVNLIRTEDA